MLQNNIDEYWKLWNECLTGKDSNSIYQQIFQMIWDTAIFHIINESINKKESCSDNAKINPYFFHFIAKNYYQHQCASIRRLIDCSSSLTNRKRGVYSLKSLIKDIQTHRLELTRTEFFRLHNLQFDYSETRKRELDFLRMHSNGSAVVIPRELNSELVEETHKKFDRLSGKTEHTRTTEDIIRDEVFTKILEKLESCDNIKNYVDKFIAHSATPGSISTLKPEDVKVTFGDIWKAHQTIILIAHLLEDLLSLSLSPPLPLEPADFYILWDKPLYQTEEEDRLREVFNNYREKTEKWLSNTDEEVWIFIETE